MSEFPTVTLPVDLAGAKDGYVVVYNETGSYLKAVSPLTFVSVPKPITHLTTVTCTDTTVSLAWVGTESALSYEIQLENGSSFTTTDTYYTVTDLSPGKTYDIYVSSVNQVGKSTSEIISIKTLQKPEAVTDLQVKDVAQQTLTLSWTSALRASSYDILANGTLLGSTVLTSYNVVDLIPDTAYTFTVRAKNEVGVSSDTTVAVRTLEVKKEDLVFKLDFTGRAGSKANTIIDDVAGLTCTLVNVAHAGNDGYIDDNGLKVGVSGYVTAPVNLIAQDIDMTSGVTFEFVGYMDRGVVFRTQPTELRAYVTNSNIVNMKYNTTASTAKIYGASSYWFKDPYGASANKSTMDALHFKSELSVITVRIHPSGRCEMAINGWTATESLTPPADFASFVDSLATKAIHIRRDETALNLDSATLNSFSIYNKVLTNQEVLDRYNEIKNAEPLREVNIHPAQVAIGVGESQLLAVVATPSRYTKLLTKVFDSQNNGFATVDNIGLLRGVANGDTQVSVTSTYGGQTFVNYVPVTIGTSTVEPPPPTRTLRGIAINRKTSNLEVGQAFPVMATTLPFDVFYDNVVVWETSNPAVCSVDFGVLNAQSAGTAVITAYDGSRTFSESFTLTVTEPVEVVILPEEIYSVPVADYGIKLDNTDEVNTTNGIQAALNYASANGFKKTVFPFGTYLITPEARTIFPPSHMITDFSDATVNIAPNNLSKTKYTMIKFTNVTHSKIINMHIYGEADSVVEIRDANEACLSVMFADACYRCGLEHCTINKSPGFNICASNSSGGDQPGRHPSKDNWEAGLIDDISGLNDNSNLVYCFRSINFLNVDKLGSSYNLGYTQGYCGYPHLRSRLYHIYFYDQDKKLITVHKNNLQFYSYDTPANVKYAKLVIFQDFKPPTHDSDFSAVAMLRTYHMPVECFIRNCKIEDNTSCGFALTGGRAWVIENNTFSRNGKRMPSCDIDWEDGWEQSIGDVCRRNTFNSPSGVIFSGNQSTALYDNVFSVSNLHVWKRSINFRIFNNFFDEKSNNRNITLETGGDSYFQRNVLKTVRYTKMLAHPEAIYRIRDDNNTLL